MARIPKSVSVSSCSVITAPGFDMSLDSLTNVADGFLVTVFISIPFRDKVANGLGSSANDFHNIISLEKSAVT